MTDDANQVTNYNRYRIRDIHKTVRELSPEQKQKLLDKIELRKGVSNLNGQKYDEQTCKLVEKLLTEKSPK